MAVTKAAFTTSGGGRLDPEWFTDLDALLDAWISASEPGSDELVTARVYCRAFTFLSDSFMSDPSMQRDRNKTSQFSAEQLSYWARQAAKFQAEVDALTGNVGPVITPWEGRKHVY